MRKADIPALPHSWAVDQWPPDIFPGGAGKGRYVCRIHRKELLDAGALVRVGRQLVIVGGNYHGWLARKATRVPDFKLAVNDATRHGAGA